MKGTQQFSANTQEAGTLSAVDFPSWALGREQLPGPNHTVGPITFSSSPQQGVFLLLENATVEMFSCDSGIQIYWASRWSGPTLLLPRTNKRSLWPFVSYSGATSKYEKKESQLKNTQWLKLLICWATKWTEARIHTWWYWRAGEKVAWERLPTFYAAKCSKAESRNLLHTSLSLRMFRGKRMK